MLYGIGCDLCEVARMEKSLSGAHGPAFVRRVFGPAEQAALGLGAEAEPWPAGRHNRAWRGGGSQVRCLRFALDAFGDLQVFPG